MTNMFAQYPPGTTGSFTVNTDGSVKLDVNIPKPRKSNLDPVRTIPGKKYWILDGTGMSREKIKGYLMSCGAMFGFANDTDTKIHFSSRSIPDAVAHRIAPTDMFWFKRAVAQSGWYGDRNNYRVINVRDVPMYDPPY